MKTKHFLTLVMAFAFALVSQARVYTHQSVPSPKVQGQDFYVANPDGVLEKETVDELNALCTRLNLNTGVELAVVAIMEFDENTYTSYDFALALFNYWGIGGGESNTGVLVFLAEESRRIQIITGDGIAGMLTDAKCGELLDNNISYLAEDDFDGGIWHLCKDIEDFLMEDTNRAELLLGWAPEDTVGSDLLVIYLFAGFILMIFLAIWGYKKLIGKPGQPESNVLAEAKGPQSCMGCMSFIFPIPILFLYLYYRFFKKHPRLAPMNCKKCGHVMERMPENLNQAQIKEQELRTMDYARWHCPECGEDVTLKYHSANYYKYSQCPECGGRTMECTHKKTVRHATFLHEGERIDTYTCRNCGHVKDYTVVLERKRINSSGGSGSGGGSWGGGSSSGGGAGRSF